MQFLNLISTMEASKLTLFVLVTFRIFNAISLSTFFNPDEYWQSLEVAHRSVFGFVVLNIILMTYDYLL